MEKFLNKVAQKVLAEHGGDLHKVAVVFNNQRPGVFLRREFARLNQGALRLPMIMGMDDLVGEMSGLRVVPHEFLLFELYEVYREMQKTEVEPFEDFMPRGELMLGDFSKVDLYGVDAKELFTNVKDVKEIESWSVEDGDTVSFRGKYWSFYASLLDYYTEFRNRLMNKGIAYSGMACREVADKRTQLISHLSMEYYYFVGFNAFSTSEGKIVDAIVRSGKGTVIADGDAYYFEDPKQEAGFFLRKNAKIYQSVRSFEWHFGKGEKRIDVVGCGDLVSEVKYAANLLEAHLDDEAWLSDTAVVLADTNLLVPMLNSLPQLPRGVNVTMGFPFTFSDAHIMLQKYFDLMGQDYVKHNGYYHLLVREWVSDPLVSLLLNSGANKSLVTFLGNKRYVTRDDMQRFLIGNSGAGMETLWLSLFTASATSAMEGVLVGVRMLIERVYGTIVCDGSRAKEREALGCALQVITHLQEIATRYDSLNTISVLRKLYMKFAQRVKVALIGEPLHGVQIMGMLETRALDFGHLIVLGVNEGVMPSARSENSLIPFDIRCHFGIPTYREEDAVYAYNFFRLLQRASDVSLVYCSDVESSGKGESSRYIRQIENELCVKYNNILFSKKEVVVPHMAVLATPAVNDDAVARYREREKLRFSASSLNCYRKCPRQFYYKYVLGLREEEDLCDDMSASELGTLVHAVLQQSVYTKGAQVDVPTLKKAKDGVDSLVKEAYREALGRDVVLGKDLLNVEVAKKELLHFLEQEMAVVEAGKVIVVNEMEQEKEMPFPVKYNGQEKVVVLNGQFDRVDTFEGHKRILDYKTGNVDEKQLCLEEGKIEAMSEKLFQLLIYRILDDGTQLDRTYETWLGIVPLRMLSRKGEDVSMYAIQVDGKEKSKVFSPQVMEAFREYLNGLLERILFTDRCFEKNEKECDYCFMKRVCKLFE